MRKLFKKEVGATPHEYLLGLRMRRAQTLISSGVSSGYGVLTVAQIAESCGFGTAWHNFLYRQTDGTYHHKSFFLSRLQTEPCKKTEHPKGLAAERAYW
jgi:AraC-like DNA-binding protein